MHSTRTSTNPVIRTGIQVMAFGVAAAFVLLFAVDPHSVGANASQNFEPTVVAAAGGEQSLDVAAGSAQSVTRDGYTVKDPPAPEPVVVPVAVKAEPSTDAPAAAGAGCEANVVPTPGPPAPGSLQDIAYQAVMGYGWGEQNYYYLLALWNRESGWNPTASNPSGAYGIPQALPGSKMGPGWESDPNVQINWGLQYIAGSYGTPCEAWATSENQGWY
ncbi:lytic transglycosylase domain-containing protein [Herbiconiux sp. CPCC 205763]|uniref:Lytic transglycosylase domain-containing protein n=1 Tax=Herbiconiux aconitum TaxID=2970913 RepID=A0ABT2GTJ4_9MICO|nr:transglycosylase SLT domain-containing protein [Herbiconiux aconitum]MCS5718620.1 lytic transglycosylase domain-containing protein [Herbiconiux aconitum]